MSIVPPPPQPIFETLTSNNSSKPAEVFRKDLISAMKLPDSYQLQQEEYFLITDQWKQEWEKGVQVPVNDGGDYPQPAVRTVPLRWQVSEFKLPKKLLKWETNCDNEQSVSVLECLADSVCRYDLDDVDTQWLINVNHKREEMGDCMIDELTMERIMEECEKQCHDNMTHAILTKEGLGIEYDEDVICDVCRSPDCEEGNEMVFCDACDICVHQACYGIVKIPEGSWMCRTCALGIQPQCILCPKKKGAMKSTRSGTKWAHVSCSLWIPEVSIGCVEKMEPITRISQIPSSRWALICNICRERTGACIQCCVKTCKTAYHVTCGFQHNLEMKTYLDDCSDVKFKSFCMRHTKRRLQGELDVTDSPIKSTPKKEKTQEQEANERALRIQQLEDEFYKQVKFKEVANALSMESNKIAVDMSNFNRPLLSPKKEDSGTMSQAEEDSLVARMRMFVHLRQDLERVRNLCYMVQRREKLSRTYNRLREQIFHRQTDMLDNDAYCSAEDLAWIDTAIQRSEKEIVTVIKTDNIEMEHTSENNSHADSDTSRTCNSNLSYQSSNRSNSRRRRGKRWNRRHRYSSSSSSSLSSLQKTSSQSTLKESISLDIQAEVDKGGNTNNNAIVINNETDSLLSNNVSERQLKENRTVKCDMKRESENKKDENTNCKRHRSNGKYRSLSQRRMANFFSKGNLTIDLDSPPQSRRRAGNNRTSRKDRASLKRTEISPRQESMRDEAAKVRESLFAMQSSPMGSLSGYRIPKKTAVSPADILKSKAMSTAKGYNESSNDSFTYTLETRSTRRRIKNELDRDSNSTDRQFENVDDEISICRSSREPSPTVELDDIEKPVIDSESSIDVQSSSSGSQYDSDSENSSSSDEHSGPVTRRRNELSSSGKYQFRSRLNDGVGKLWSTATGL
uniref:Protein Jade-3-like n=1 Tax=Saccoglossus kowalevskii TaxID=10224 RepID=A0ABM0GWZ5_SACKO|nr:PREDICTED: protein Jade-3-like [Saccoglossus kowalevskii]